MIVRLTLLALMLMTGPALAQAPLMAGQEWSGRYRCAQGDTLLTVQIREVGGEVDASTGVSAIFVFGGRGKTQGAYSLKGRYSTRTGTVELAPERWIQRPAGYLAVGMTGRISGDGTRFIGRIDSPLCGDFTLATAAPASSGRAGTTVAGSGSSGHVAGQSVSGATPGVTSEVGSERLPSKHLLTKGSELGEKSAGVLDRLPPPKVDPADLAAPCENTGYKFADHDADYDWQKFAGIHIWNSNRLFHWAKTHLPLQRFERQSAGRGDKGCLDGQFIARVWQTTFGHPVTGILTVQDVKPMVDALEGRFVRPQAGRTQASDWGEVTRETTAKSAAKGTTVRPVAPKGSLASAREVSKEGSVQVHVDLIPLGASYADVSAVLPDACMRMETSIACGELKLCHEESAKLERLVQERKSAEETLKRVTQRGRYRGDPTPQQAQQTVQDRRSAESEADFVHRACVDEELKAGKRAPIVSLAGVESLDARFDFEDRRLTGIVLRRLWADDKYASRALTRVLGRPEVTERTETHSSRKIVGWDNYCLPADMTAVGTCALGRESSSPIYGDVATEVRYEEYRWQTHHARLLLSKGILTIAPR